MLHILLHKGQNEIVPLGDEGLYVFLQSCATGLIFPEEPATWKIICGCWKIGQKQCKLQFNISKCKIMNAGKNYPLIEYTVRGSVLPRTAVEKDLGVFTSAVCKIANNEDRQLLKRIEF